MNRFENLFPDTYFDDRFFNQSERKKSIELEAEWLRAFGINFTGSVCDVGCSTGEFLEYTKWSGKKYGMEVNQKAMHAAQKQGIKFNKNILNSTSYFDVVIMRGVISIWISLTSISNKPKIHLKRVAIWYSYKPQILAVLLSSFSKFASLGNAEHIFSS